MVPAGSNLVTGSYPTQHLTGPQEPAHPDGLYGVSKVGVEALGRLYADKCGPSAAFLRTGSFEQASTEPRHLATWTSPRDTVGYVKAALTGPASIRGFHPEDCGRLPVRSGPPGRRCAAVTDLPTVPHPLDLQSYAIY